MKQEKWNDFWKEAEPLMRLHHDEVGERGVHFELDQERINLHEAFDCVRFWTARIDGKLVGYIVWYLVWHLFSKGLLVSQMGPWYVAKEARHSATAMKLWATAKKDLKEQGVRVMMPHHQFKSEIELDRLYQRHGGSPYEMTYFMWLDKPEVGD